MIKSKHIFNLLTQTKKKRRSPPSKTNIKSILIITYDALGDLIVTTPAIRAVREIFPDARIDLLVHERNKIIVENSSHCNQIYSHTKKDYSKSWSLLLTLRSKKYDLLLDFFGRINLRMYFFINILRANYAIAIRKEEYHENKYDIKTADLPIYDHVIGNNQTKHTRDRLLEITDYFNHKPSSLRYEFNLPLWAKQKAQTFLPKGNDIIAFNFFGSRENNTLTPSQSIDLIRDFLTKFPQSKILLIAPPNRERCLSDILSNFNTDSILAPPVTTNIYEVGALLDSCNLVLSPSTSIVHIGSALNKKMIVIQPDNYFYNTFNPTSDNFRISYSISENDISEINTSQIIQFAEELLKV
ncbi:MAG: glycosyltransferase family 9 protein [Planctomycetes bacterium]|nr:glycosyltransferase family 9 protein [Planctomycetota bacterium]